ncbi:MAG: cobalamin biosynthesis protein [Rhodospirillales bacterium]|nr:cobalamin biosynthesis protein [Rhodospirillales bacterium]
MLQNGATTLLILAGALALELWLAAMPPVLHVLRHPFRAIDGAVDWLDRRLNRENRSERARRERGFVAVVLILVPVAALGALVGGFLALPRFGWAVELVVVAALVEQRGTFEAATRVADALAREGLGGGRRAALPFAGRDPSALDLHGIVRATTEELAERYVTRLVAPAFWYVLFGLAGLFSYVALARVAARLRVSEERYVAFGSAAAMLFRASLAVPAALGALLAAATSVASAGGLRSFAALRRQLRNASAQPALLPVAAFAGALDLALAGPGSGRGIDWIGDGRARAETADLHRALALFTGAAALHLAFWLALYAALPA